jgi:hypothetical protein
VCFGYSLEGAITDSACCGGIRLLALSQSYCQFVLPSSPGKRHYNAR